MSHPSPEPLPHGKSPPLEPDARSEAERMLGRNFVALFFHGMLGQTGFRLLQAPTFLPTYVSTLTGVDSAAALARAVQSLGMFLSPLLSAHLVERRRRVKKLAFAIGAAMRAQVLMLALIALFLPRSTALILLWPVLGLWGLMMGMQAVAFNFLLSKSIPVGYRGRLHGLRNLTSGLTLLGVAAVAGIALDRFGFPRGYGMAFLIAFVLTSLGLASLFWLHEPASVSVGPAVSLTSRLGQVKELLRAEPDFRAYLRGRLLATASRGVMPFYVLSLAQVQSASGQEMNGAQLGALTISFTAAQAVSAVIWGLLADRRGFRSVFLGALGCWLGANLLTLLVPDLRAAYPVFALLGAGLSGIMMASTNLILEFGVESDRAIRIAATNSLAEASGMLGFLAVALAATLVPYFFLFLGAGAIQLAALYEFTNMEEPRRLGSASG